MNLDGCSILVRMHQLAAFDLIIDGLGRLFNSSAPS